jgi:type III secretory pathway component EscS
MFICIKNLVTQLQDKDIEFFQLTIIFIMKDASVGICVIVGRQVDLFHRTILP